MSGLSRVATKVESEAVSKILVLTIYCFAYYRNSRKSMSSFPFLVFGAAGFFAFPFPPGWGHRFIVCPSTPQLLQTHFLRFLVGSPFDFDLFPTDASGTLPDRYRSDFFSSFATFDAFKIFLGFRLFSYSDFRFLALSFCCFAMDSPFAFFGSLLS